MPAGGRDRFVAERRAPGSGSADLANAGPASGRPAVGDGGVRGAGKGLAGRHGSLNKIDRLAF